MRTRKKIKRQEWCGIKPIQKNGWYHVHGDKTYHYFKRDNGFSLCGKVNSVKSFLRGINSWSDINKCIDCNTLYQKLKSAPVVTYYDVPETHYTKTSCPDCQEDCVVISAKPVLQDKVHVHIGCPVND